MSLSQYYPHTQRMRFFMMNIALIEQQVWSWFKPVAEGDCLLVPTSLFYPSGLVAMVYFEDDCGGILLSDGGGAIKVLHEMGDYKTDALSLLEDLIDKDRYLVNAAGWIAANKVIRENESFLPDVFDLDEASVSASRSLLKTLQGRDMTEATSLTYLQ